MLEKNLFGEKINAMNIKKTHRASNSKEGIHYITLNNKFNLSMFFIENSLDLLRKSGRLSFILDISFFEDAYIDMRKYLQLIAKAQYHIDQGISTVLYVDTNTTTKELVQLYVYAWKLGLKSLYYTRVKNLDVTECESCSV